MVNIQNPPFLNPESLMWKFHDIFAMSPILNLSYFPNILNYTLSASKCPHLYHPPFFEKFSSPSLYPIFIIVFPHFYQYSPSQWNLGILLKIWGYSRLGILDFKTGDFEYSPTNLRKNFIKLNSGEVVVSEPGNPNSYIAASSLRPTASSSTQEVQNNAVNKFAGRK